MSGAIAEVEAVLTGHAVLSAHGGEVACTCDARTWMPWHAHPAHVAAALAEAGLLADGGAEGGDHG